MAEQSGPRDPSERPGTERPGTERPGTERPGTERPNRERPATDRPRQSSPPRVDLAGDFQRWLIRQGAKNVRKEIGGQVRRTFGGGGRSSSGSDVWDTVTNEIPPEVGEAPECQWCPICRAARRMRESGPGIGGQLSGAGDAVASAVQDAFSALDGLLSKTGGDNAQRDGEPRGTSPHATEPRQTAPQGIGPPESARHSETGPSDGPAGRQSAWSTATHADNSDAKPAQADEQPGTQHDRQGNEPDDRS